MGKSSVVVESPAARCIDNLKVAGIGWIGLRRVDMVAAHLTCPANVNLRIRMDESLYSFLIRDSN